MPSFDVAVIGLGALGSATAAALAGRGVSVVGLEQFELGHDRGASHDTSRIIRHSYHTQSYVALSKQAYADWVMLEESSGASLVTTTGGVDLFPPGAAIPMIDYTTAMDTEDIAYDVLDADEVTARWAALRPPPGTAALYQAETGIVPAARGTTVMQRLATVRGATLHRQTPVTGLRPDTTGIQVVTPGGTLSVGSVVVTADAWVEPLLRPLGIRLGLTVTEEQVSYFAPPQPGQFAVDAFPVWIWMDDPSYYGFPMYGEATVKAAQDCGGPVVTAEDRSGQPDRRLLAGLSGFLAGLVPGSGPPVRSRRCLYTLTPDRDFVLGPVPGEPRIVVGLGAGHGFKFAPTFGRLLADLALGGLPGPELHPFRLDRRALVDAAYATSWLV
ncbi:MAG: N-methyl-L-tryptophan oxidase [Geodermatophilaceae bacterium]|nr:N-methyl-L-tryptophan oxidase [Geodermatophilaceae bacterium]